MFSVLLCMNFVSIAFQELEMCTFLHFAVYCCYYIDDGNLLKFELSDCFDFFFQACQH